MPPRFCEVALPVPMRSLFTYSIPARFDSEELLGRRVLVPFRNRKMIGVIAAFAENPLELKQVKEISELLDPIPALPPNLIELGNWISRYYVAPIGESLNSLLPPQPDLRQEREYNLTEAGAEYLEELIARGPADEKEVAELAVLDGAKDASNPWTSAQIRRIAGGDAAADRLVRAKRLEWSDILLQRKTRTQKIVAWKNAARTTAPALDEKSTRIREALIEFGGPMQLPVLIERAKVTKRAVENLESAGHVVIWEEPLSPEDDPWESDYGPPNNILNAEQKTALTEIQTWLEPEKFQPPLLHGETGSGKTEVYLSAIKPASPKGKSALVLVPEIALTLWMGRHVRARFGPRVAVLHSALPDAERAREWWRVRRGDARIVVGTRSAVFAPLQNLGLILVDEEQETAYKQEETPRYNGRDTAIYRAHLENVVAVLGSATPSLESYQNARTGKYKLLELKTPVKNRPMAKVTVVDLREDFRAHHKNTPVSEALRRAISERLANGTQAMVLINRRGYSWFL